MRLRYCALLAACALAVQAAGPKQTWRIAYFYDKVQQNFNIADIACPSDQRCVAVGAIEEEGKLRPHSVVTSDGGDHWTDVPLEEAPLSVFFLNDSVGWMVTEKGLWHTRDAGAGWKKLHTEKDLLRVWFVSPLQGWLLGGGIFRDTDDGGVRWRNVTEAAKTPVELGPVTYESIHFSDRKHGVAIGEATPNGRPQENAWLRPGVARLRNPPAVILAFRTDDGGNTWTRQMLGRHQTILAAAFPTPQTAWFVFGPAAPTDVFSDITRLEWDTKSANVVFHANGALISDIAPGPDESAVVASIELPGKLADIPVPGRIRMLSGSSPADLHQDSVDYRAVARKITLAATPGRRWFAATDTGMILRRE